MTNSPNRFETNICPYWNRKMSCAAAGAFQPVRSAVVIPSGNIGRCAVTTLDPRTAVSDLNTLAALAKYRRGLVTTEPLAFGVWARVAEPGAVRVGDPVVVD